MLSQKNYPAIAGVWPDAVQIDEVSNQETLEDHRQYWAKIAKSNGWYEQPFYIVAWTSPGGQIVDSVSYQGLGYDMLLDY